MMRKLTKLFFLGWALGLVSLATGKPNILFIYTDDQSTRTVSAYEDAYHWVDTPHIDRLANEGIRFTRANIGTWCMASRASILTSSIGSSPCA